MPVPVPPHIETLVPYVAGKPISETQRELGLADVIKLASNENPLGPAPRALEAMVRAAGQMHLYPDPAGFELKRALAERLEVSTDEIVLGSGSNEVIELLVRTFCGPEDEGLAALGSFVMYRIALQAQGRRVVEVPLRELRYDLGAMAERVGPHTRLVFVANPDNPTGSWFVKQQLERFLERVDRANPETLVVLDEAYFEYATDPDYPDSLRYRGRFPNLVTARTFSKIYGLAGLRLGYGVMSAPLAAFVNRARMPFNVGAMAQAAGVAALGDAEHVRRTRENNAAGMAFLARELAAMGLRAPPSQTNFLFVELGRPAAPVYQALLARGVIVRPVANYGFPEAVRISVGLPEENARLVAALKEVLER